MAALQNAVTLEPESGEAHYQLGLALVRAGRKEEGAAQLKKGRELVAAGDRKQNAMLDITDGRPALERGDADEAASKFRRAIELLPESSEAHRYLGAALERKVTWRCLRVYERRWSSIRRMLPARARD